jgi:Mg2+/citrate symporter
MKAKLPKFSIKNRKTQVLLLVVTFIFVVFITQRDSPGIVAGIFLALVVIVVATTKQEKNLNTFGADGELRIRSVDERKLLLREFVVGKVAAGSRVELQDDFSAVLVFGTKPNHILHFILSILTAGFWLIIWLFIALGSKERRTLYKIDEYGIIKF